MTTLPMRIAVGFATCGRPDVLAAALDCVRRQMPPADAIIVCHTTPEDVAGIDPAGVQFLLSEPGLPRQRNAILDHAAEYDAVLFLDDDFLVAPNYVGAVATCMAADPTIVVATGTLIADDSRGPGLSVAQGLALLAADAPPAEADWVDAPHGYGCNMAIRVANARAHDVRFDERLPLYAWSEDMDFTHRLGRFGRMVTLRAARGVHLGVKQARSPGRRLGYSQVANPLYLRGKGSYSWRRALGSVGRNLAANAARALWSEPFIDRRGRLLGNALAMLDLARGRMRPERILDL